MDYRLLEQRVRVALFERDRIELIHFQYKSDGSLKAILAPVLCLHAHYIASLRISLRHLRSSQLFGFQSAAVHFKV